ncbi:MAG TPA: class I SAM-dependent methyltransferase [Thermoanaerobaculaceae bacterium]|nr:class I SAM-dependent methyltransferase [Thermoanaerobaculaceae bacterium]
MSLKSLIPSFAKRIYWTLRLNLLPPPPERYSAVDTKDTVVPCQIEAYFLALNRWVDEGARVLDVGFGLGYGLNILAIKASEVSGVDVDARALEHCRATVEGRNPRLRRLALYDGHTLEFPDEAFDVVTCVDVLEHVPDYDRLLDELLRVSRKGVFISTPNRRPEYTRRDGRPRNPWHLREWSRDELDVILRHHGTPEWHVLDGPFEGPFTHGSEAGPATLTLSPFLWKTAPATPSRH